MQKKPKENLRYRELFGIYYLPKCSGSNYSIIFLPTKLELSNVNKEIRKNNDPLSYLGITIFLYCVLRSPTKGHLLEHSFFLNFNSKQYGKLTGVYVSNNCGMLRGTL